MSPKRLQELTELLSKSEVKQIYISAFPTKKEFKKYFDETAWETEVWLADEPDHMIHLNGPKFLFVLDDDAYDVNVVNKWRKRRINGE